MKKAEKMTRRTTLSLRSALFICFLVGLLGFVMGLSSRREVAGTHDAHASFQEYETLAQLRSASDLVIRGSVEGAGEPFLSVGAPMKGDTLTEGDAVEMRLFSIRVITQGAAALSKGDTIQVAVLDTARVGVSGDADLIDGDDVFLFLERLDNSVFRISEVHGDIFFVVVGGRQGVFRESDNGIWNQSSDPLLVGSAMDVGRAPVLSASRAELDDVAG